MGQYGPARKPYLGYRNFVLGIKRKSEIVMVVLLNDLWFGQEKKLALPSQSIRSKPQTNHALVTHVFPRFRQFTHFHFELSLAPCDNLFSLIGRLLADYFGFGFTRLPWKVPRVASKKHLRLYQNVEKVTVSSEIFVIHWRYGSEKLERSNFWRS